MNIVILLGVTGDLARKKVIPSIHRIQKQLDHTVFLPIFGLGRKPNAPEEFYSLLDNTYVSGDLETSKVYIALKKAILDTYSLRSTKGEKMHLIIYSSLPPHLHSKVAELVEVNILGPILKAKPKLLTFKFMIEKPVGNDLPSAETEFEKFDKIFKQPAVGGVLFVDHYLAKEPLITLRSMVGSNPLLFKETIGSLNLTRIEVMLFENADVDDRGSFYDKVGALYDVAQNHLLQLLAEITRMRIDIIRCIDGAVSTKAVSKADILNSLALDGTPVFGQYENYDLVKGVETFSSTDTFFDLRAKPSMLFTKKVGRALSGITYAISSGKKMGINKSGINLVFKGGKEIFINMNAGTKDAYQYLFESVILNKEIPAGLFATKEEIKAGWKFVMRAKRLKTNSELIVYSSLHDIIG